jgi:FtsP/CotA-like multicopper oxidase with cupredoxin domain
MNPGQVTRIAVRWAPTDLPTTALASELYFPFDPSGGFQHGYVWHCHIIDHEDNEMMRPDVVQLNALAPPPGARPLVKGVAY